MVAQVSAPVKSRPTSVLINRLAYAIRDYVTAENPTTRQYNKLNNAVLEARREYGDEDARSLIRHAQKKMGVICPKLVDIRARHLPTCENPNDGTFIWDVRDEDRAQWLDPMHDTAVEDEYDGFDYLAEFEIWQDQDRFELRAYQDQHDWSYNDAPMDHEGLIGGRERVDLAVMEFVQYEQATPAHTAAAPMDLRFMGQRRRGNAIARAKEEVLSSQTRRTMLKRALETDTRTFFAIFRNRQPGQRLPFTLDEFITELANLEAPTLATFHQAYALARWQDELVGNGHFATECETWLEFTYGLDRSAVEAIIGVIDLAQAKEPQEGDDRLIQAYHAGR